MNERRGDDLGHGHFLRYTGWHPERDLNPQYDNVADIDKIGAILDHPLGSGPTDEAYRETYGRYRERGWCSSHVMFDLPNIERVIGPTSPRWTVEVWEPLTISPSVRCLICGDHGHVRGGRWVPA